MPHSHCGPIWAILPQRGFGEAKSRLAQELTPERRADLARDMFDVCLKAAKATVGLSRVVVASANHEVLDHATRAGAEVFPEAGSGLNRALSDAARAARDAGAQAVLSVFCDLPLLCANDLKVMVEAHRAGADVVLAPDRRDEGANAMLMSPPLCISYDHGEGSFDRHRTAGEAASLAVTVIRRLGLAFDIDNARDLSDLEAYRSRRG